MRQTRNIRWLVLLSWVVWSLPVVGQQSWTVGAQGDFTTLTEAVEQVDAYDTLLVQNGYFPENQIYIRKPLTVIGSSNTLIDAQFGDEILIVQSDEVEIRGLTLANVGVSYTKDRAAIRMERSKNCRIINNRLINTFFGIYLAYTSNSIVQGNIVEGEAKDEAHSANAIHLWYCKKIKVLNNQVSGHRDGIYFEFVDSSLIENNISRKNIRYGLHFMFSNHDIYRKNRFENNGVGVAVMYSRYITMEENIFADNWGSISYGILLKDIRDGEMKRNHFEHNATAIFAEGVNRMEIVENNFIDNGWAFKIMANCEQVNVVHNNFIGNSFEVATNSRYNVNTFEKNYWSGYTGYDLNRDSYGDVPYRPVKLFSYLVEKIPSSIILMRSPFVSLLEHTEKVAPTLTPETLVDSNPSMKQITW